MPRQKKGQFKPTRKWTNAVKKVLSRQAETKKFSNEVEEVSVSTATLATITNLNSMEQGLESDMRIGDEIRGFGLRIKAIFTANAAQNLFIRMAVIDADEDTFDANNDSFWLNPANNQPESLNPNVLNIIYQDYNKLQFKVLWQKVIHLAGTGSVEARDVRMLSKFIKFNHKVIYNATGVTDAKTHNLRFLLHVVDANGDTASSVERTLITSYYYQDI